MNPGLHGVPSRQPARQHPRKVTGQLSPLTIAVAEDLQQVHHSSSFAQRQQRLALRLRFHLHPQTLIDLTHKTEQLEATS